MVSKLFKNDLLKQNALRASVTGKTFIPVHKCILNWAPNHYKTPSKHFEFKRKYSTKKSNKVELFTHIHSTSKYRIICSIIF